MSNAKNITKNALCLMLISAIGVVLSFAKESVIAYFFGTSATVDAYVVAVDLPVSLFSLLSAAVSVAVIPNYTKLRTVESEKAAAGFFSNFVTLLTIVCLVMLLVLECCSNLLVGVAAPGLADDTHMLAAKLLCITLPASIMMVLIKANTGVLNSHKSFALPAAGGLLASVIFIFSLILLAKQFGIYAAVLGTLGGVGVEWVYSSLLRGKYAKYRPNIDLKDPYVKRSIHMVIPVFIGNSIEEVNKLVNKAVASTLSAGSISALHYASKISSGISNLLIMGIFSIFYPELAEKAAKKDERGLAQIYGVCLTVFILIILPLIFGGAFLKNEIVSVVYGRGAFDKESLALTAPLLVGYLVTLLFTAIRFAANDFFNAQGETKVPVINTSIGIGINIILNFILAKFLGVNGLVLATAVSTAISAVLLMIAAKKRNPFIDYWKIFVLFVKVLAAAMIMFLSLELVEPILRTIFAGMDGWLPTVLYTLAAVFLGACVYVAALWVLRVRELRDILMILLKKKSKKEGMT